MLFTHDYSFKGAHAEKLKHLLATNLIKNTLFLREIWMSI